MQVVFLHLIQHVRSYSIISSKYKTPHELAQLHHYQSHYQTFPAQSRNEISHWNEIIINDLTVRKLCSVREVDRYKILEDGISRLLMLLETTGITFMKDLRHSGSIFGDKIGRNYN